MCSQTYHDVSFKMYFAKTAPDTRCVTGLTGQKAHLISCTSVLNETLVVCRHCGVAFVTCHWGRDVLPEPFETALRDRADAFYAYDEHE